jgi:hypothetical protein
VRVAYCTIASANYLPRVRVLQESLIEHNPGASFHLLLCEWPEVCRSLSSDTGHVFVTPEDVCPDWLHMAFYYDIVEYNTALKPYFIEYLFANGYDAVFYLDPDIEVYDSFHALESLAENYDLLLTPHVCQPMPMDSISPGIDDIIRAGQFNLGFIGMRKSEEAARALRWWRDVCHEYCLFDSKHRFFVDQFWAAALPSFVQKFYCLRDPGCNMAYWNVFQRELQFREGRWSTGDDSLKFFHFSGLDDDLTQVSKHQHRVKAPVGSPLYELLVKYREKIAVNTWAKYSAHVYSFARYLDGRTISPDERKSFLRLGQAQRDRLGNPFVDRATVQHLRNEQGPDARWALVAKYVAAIRQHGMLSANVAAMRFLGEKVARYAGWLIKRR